MRRTIKPVITCVSLFFASDAASSLVPAVEYIIPSKTINPTQISPTRNVAYWIRAFRIFVAPLNHG
jgi:hypothetical protein